MNIFSIRNQRYQQTDRNALRQNLQNSHSNRVYFVQLNTNSSHFSVCVPGTFKKGNPPFKGYKFAKMRNRELCTVPFRTNPIEPAMELGKIKLASANFFDSFDFR